MSNSPTLAVISQSATALRISVIGLKGISRVLSQNYDILCKFAQRLSGDANQASRESRTLLRLGTF
jgi:hypothetical protein